jgi:hypothetical protein
MIKVIIAGGRNFDDFNKLCQVCDEFLQDQNNIEIVSGAYKGADLLGEKYAAERNYPIKQFPADWRRYGKSTLYCCAVPVEWRKAGQPGIAERNKGNDLR